MYIYIGNKEGTQFVGSDILIEYNSNPNKNLIEEASLKSKGSKSEEDIIDYLLLVHPLDFTSEVLRAYPFVKDHNLVYYLRGLDQRDLKLPFEPVIYYMNFHAVIDGNEALERYELSLEQMTENLNKAIEELKEHLEN